MTKKSTLASALAISSQDCKRCHNILGIDSWKSLEGLSVLFTGGTGFIGKWLLATLLDADESLDLNCRITVLSRNPSAFQRVWPVFASRINWISGNVCDFPMGRWHFDVIIHAATDVVSHSSPQDIFSTCLDGTRRVLQLARQAGTSRFLLLSSGAVYGPLPEGMTHVAETYNGGPDPLLAASAYGEGKRVSEWLVSQASTGGLEAKIARIFTLVGPHLSLNKHFAIGNFLRAALAGEEILVEGDGTPFRSYLYAADMAAWLWAVLLKGKPGRAYNVGSEESLSISAIADRTLSVLKCPSRIKILNKIKIDTPSRHYVPNTMRARTELNLPPALALDEAILRTANWYRERGILYTSSNL